MIPFKKIFSLCQYCGDYHSSPACQPLPVSGRPPAATADGAGPPAMAKGRRQTPSFFSISW